MVKVAHVALLGLAAGIVVSLAALVSYAMAFGAVVLTTAARGRHGTSPEQELAALVESDLNRVLREILDTSTRSGSP